MRNYELFIRGWKVWKAWKVWNISLFSIVEHNTKLQKNRYIIDICYLILAILCDNSSDCTYSYSKTKGISCKIKFFFLNLHFKN